MQAGVGGFADRVQVGDVGAGVAIGDHAAAGVVRRRHDRNRFAGDVDAEFQAALVDRREVLLDERRRLVADIQVQAVGAEALHLVVDGARDDVARGEVGARVETLHEGLAVRQQQLRALATQCLRDQEGFRLAVVQAGRMKLHELHVRHPAAGAPRHRDAVAGGDIRVAGVQVDLARSAGGERGEARAEGTYAVALDVQQIGAETGLAAIRVAAVDQVDGDMVLEDVDVVARARLVHQGHLQRATGGVGGMHHAAMAVTAFAGQVQAGFLAGELDAGLLQPADAGGAVFDHHADGILVAQAGAGVQRVGDMRGSGILRVDHRRDAALGIQGVAFLDVAFRDQRDP